MKVYTLQIDKRNRDEWELIGVFSSEDKAYIVTNKMKLLPTQICLTTIFVDEYLENL